jgi:tetratricopeptide (TPR) repeat protein
MPRKKSTHIDDPIAAGNRVKEARERAGLSQRQLAFPGCSAAYISRIEAGTRTPSERVLRELGERLGVSEAWLATGVEAVGSSLLRDADIALRLDDSEEAARLFSDVLESGADPRTRSSALEGLAKIAIRNGDPRLAIDLGEQALQVVGEQPEDRPMLAESMARAHAALGEMAAAIAILTRCVDRMGDDALQFVRFSSLLGAALTDSGNFAEAERVIGSALARGREIADPYARARLYWSQSRLLGEEGDIERAEVYARRTLETLRATEDEYAIGHILQTLAHITIDLGRPEEALELLREGWPKIAAAGTPLEIAQFRIEEARALAAVGNADEAGKLAMEVTRALGDAHPTDAGRAYLLLGETYATLGDTARAREVLELAVELLEERGPSRYLVKAYKQLAGVLREQGEHQLAFEVLERALNVREAVGRPLA